MRYVALLRGIGANQPQYEGRTAEVRFRRNRFKKVHPVITSGNVIFDSSSKNSQSLEGKIEKAIKLTEGKIPDFMSKMDREHGKAITSRTWKTIGRILEKMEETGSNRKPH
jgi:uncharacterized protein (DUF1697 family)